MDPIDQVRAFAEATDLEGKWSSARQMMSSKAKPLHTFPDHALVALPLPEPTNTPCPTTTDCLLPMITLGWS
jgi:hypothetical protein